MPPVARRPSSLRLPSDAARAAVAELFAAHGDRLYASAIRLCGRSEEAEDLVQETLLAIHLHRGTWEASLPVSAWMIAIARHKLIDLWRRRGRRDGELASLDELEDHEAPSADDREEHAARRDLGVLLRSIPPAQREAIVLTKIEGLTVAEVSVRTGASVAAVKVQVHRGLKKLAELVRTTR